MSETAATEYAVEMLESRLRQYIDGLERRVERLEDRVRELERFTG